MGDQQLTSRQTGQIKSPDDIPEGDFRKSTPRFQPDVFDENLKLVKEIQTLAQKKGYTPGQVAIAWIREQSKKQGMPEIIPIPGAGSKDRVTENMKQVSLSKEDMDEIEKILKTAPVIGDRYGHHQKGLLFGDSPPLHGSS